MPTLDKNGHPVVVITGMGIVTSLGAGKTDNWQKLTAGESGIREITRFPTDGLKTRVAGAVNFMKMDDPSAAELAEHLAETAAEEAVAESGLGTRGDFPGPLFLAVAPIEVEWPQREALALAAGSNGAITYDDLVRSAATGKFKNMHAVSYTHLTLPTILRV